MGQSYKERSTGIESLDFCSIAAKLSVVSVLASLPSSRDIDREFVPKYLESKEVN